jgi:small subunit ribosomal protein S9
MMSIITTSGKRKMAIARVSLKPGKGIVRVNHKLLETLQPEMARLKIKEPLLLAGALAAKYDIEISVAGGGVISQAEAIRLAIARALVKGGEDPSLEQTFDSYDRHLLVADVRRKEVRKPNSNSKARSKKQKSYR